MKRLFMVGLLLAVSFAGARLFLWLVNPNDSEGSNLLVPGVLAAGIWCALVSILVVKSQKNKKSTKK